MTNEVLAAIEGARAAGATEFLVSDSHGNGENLLIERFPKDVQIVRSWPRPLAMMQGIDASFDAVLFVGYHSSTTNTGGRPGAHDVLGHPRGRAARTASRCRRPALNAAIAGHFRVPVAMISGDDAIVKEAQALLGPDRGRGREVELRLPLGAHADAGGELRPDPREGEEGDRPAEGDEALHGLRRR